MEIPSEKIIFTPQCIFVVLYIEYFLVVYSIKRSLRTLLDKALPILRSHTTRQPEVNFPSFYHKTKLIWFCLAKKHIQTQLPFHHTHFHMNAWLWNWKLHQQKEIKKIYLISENYRVQSQSAYLRWGDEHLEFWKWSKAYTR